MGGLDVDVQTNALFRLWSIPNPIQIRVRGKNLACIETITDVVDGTTRDEIEPTAAIRGYRQVRSQPDCIFPHETWGKSTTVGMIRSGSMNTHQKQSRGQSMKKDCLIDCAKSWTCIHCHYLRRRFRTKCSINTTTPVYIALVVVFVWESLPNSSLCSLHSLCIQLSPSLRCLCSPDWRAVSVVLMVVVAVPIVILVFVVVVLWSCSSSFLVGVCASVGSPLSLLLPFCSNITTIHRVCLIHHALSKHSSRSQNHEE